MPLLGLLLTGLILSPGVAWAQTPWPASLSTREPGLSQSPVSVVIWSVNIEPPGPGVAPDKARWAGKWSGWACRDQACDVKLIVEHVTPEGARVITGFASATVKPNTSRGNAQFVGEELQVKWRDGSATAYRMRPEGDIELLWRSSDSCVDLSRCEWHGGVLSKEK